MLVMRGKGQRADIETLMLDDKSYGVLPCQQFFSVVYHL